jgi:hypothetical protein
MASTHRWAADRNRGSCSNLAPSPERLVSFILTAAEGDLIGNHRVKADPKTGSMRLAVGLQHFTGGNGISLHMHEKEDEGRFALFFDFTTGSKITVQWGADLERSSDWTLAESHH